MGAKWSELWGWGLNWQSWEASLAELLAKLAGLGYKLAEFGAKLVKFWFKLATLGAQVMLSLKEILRSHWAYADGFLKLLWRPTGK